MFPQDFYFSVHRDSMVHKKLIFHDREVMIDGFYKHIPPTSSVKMDERGHYDLVEQGALKEFSFLFVLLMFPSNALHIQWHNMSYV